MNETELILKVKYHISVYHTISHIHMTYVYTFDNYISNAGKTQFSIVGNEGN